jgi:hypothetical protein
MQSRPKFVGSQHFNYNYMVLGILIATKQLKNKIKLLFYVSFFFIKNTMEQMLQQRETKQKLNDAALDRIKTNIHKSYAAF